MGKDADEEKGDGGSHTLIYVSGAAALVLLALLVYAVLDTADHAAYRDRENGVFRGEELGQGDRGDIRER